MASERSTVISIFGQRGARKKPLVIDMIPPLRLRRLRLEALIGAGLANGVTVIEAPFGTGKSELLRAVGVSAQQAGAIVQRFNLGDTDVEGRLAGLERQLQAEIDLGRKNNAQTLFLVDADDVNESAIIERIGRLTAMKAPHVDMVIAVRPIPAAHRHLVRMSHTVISESDLAFTWEEFRELAELVGANRSRPLATFDAYRQTEGWAHAIAALIGEWRRGRVGVDALRESLELDVAIDGTFISSKERELYFALSFLPKYNRELLNAVAGHLGIDRDELATSARSNAFPASHHSGWSVLHGQVSKALRREARLTWDGDVRALQVAAIEWYASAGAAEDALTLALELGDKELVANIAANFGQQLVSYGRIETLVAVGDRFSPVDLGDTRAVVSVIWALMFGGASAQARGYLRAVQLKQGYDSARMVELMADCLDVCDGTYKPRNLDRAAAPSTGNQYLDAVAADLDTLDAIEFGHFEEACERQATLRAQTHGIETADAFGPMTYGEVLCALAHLLDGRVDEGRYFAARAMKAAEAAYGFRAPAAGFAASYLAEILFLMGRLTDIDQLVAGRLDVIEHVAFPDGAARALGTLARTAALRNRWDEAYESLDRLDLLVRRRNWTIVQPYLWSEQARIALIQGNERSAERAQARLDTAVQQAAGRTRPSMRFWNVEELRDLSAIRLQWASGNSAGAERAARRLGERETDWQTRLSLSAFLPSGEENGESTHPLVRLERLLFHRRPDKLRAGQLEPLGPAGEALKQACRALGLTSGEEKILGLLLSGLSYKHIAIATALSVNTVKWHLKRIYTKLEVDGRSGAVLKMASLTAEPR